MCQPVRTRRTLRPGETNVNCYRRDDSTLIERRAERGCGERAAQSLGVICKVADGLWRRPKTPRAARNADERDRLWSDSVVIDWS